MSTEAELWRSCSELLQVQLSQATWLTWFAALKPITIEADVLVLAAPSSLVRERIRDCYLATVEEVASQVSGSRLTLKLLVEPPDAAASIELPAPRVGLQSSLESAPRPGPANKTSRSSGHDDKTGTGQPLNPRYTFDTFVIGVSNRFAHAAAQGVAATRASSYNPLFIYGESGLGKTHLLHAIGHQVRKNFPDRHVRYVSTETFMKEFIHSIRTNSRTAFKRRYRACDTLLVDDIQFVENKEGLQEEFFHTFNSLYEGNKQIVLTSDRHPRAIGTLEDRLRSRFEWGLITDIRPPEFETRLAIVRKKAEADATDIPDEVLQLIATHVTDNIRELEGALNRISPFTSLNREPLTGELAKTLLADILATHTPRHITPNVILEATASEFGIAIDDLCGTSRLRPLVNARQISMYAFRELTDFSYPAIAHEFGGRDHTTVIHAVYKVAGLMKERQQVYDQVTALIHRIKSGD